MRFSEKFKLNKTQAELDFVDIPVNKDLALFIDPYAISLENDIWCIDCNNIIVDFFNLVVQTLKSSNPIDAKEYLARLNEPNDTHLGLSRGHPAGRGVGRDQASYIYNKLKASKAVKTGFLKDLSDCELIIPGIDRDKISDVTTNIIKLKLIEYTERQCHLHDIDLNSVPSGFFWDTSRLEWRNVYVNLPVINEQRIILVPKAIVRYGLSYNYQYYYTHFVLNYLQAEHLNAGTSLVKVLKNGKRKVLKKDLKKEYPCTKEFLYDFSESNTQVLVNYKNSLPQRSLGLSDKQIEEKQTRPKKIDIRNLIKKLNRIKPGHTNASKYHKEIIGILEGIFHPSLKNPTKDQKLHEGRKRIDITFDNGQIGFFKDMITLHGITCPYIFVEAKNYFEDPKNPELDQLTGRFSDKRGVFGILVCRKVKDKNLMIKKCKDVINDNRGYIIVLDDADIIDLLHFKAGRETQKIDDFMKQKLKEILF